MANKDDYLPQIALINGNSGNGLDFFWSDYSIDYGDLTPSTTISNIKDNTFSVPRNQRDNGIVSSAFTSLQLMSYVKLTATIISLSNSVSLSIPDLRNFVTSACNYSTYGAYWFFLWDTISSSNKLYTDNNHRGNESTFWSLWIWETTYTATYSDIGQALAFLGRNFRNINIIVDGEDWTEPTPSPITSNGGGATHIAKVTGQLKDLSSNLSDILMVSGGGGGGLLVGETDYSGKEAGGISGSGDNSADQSTGNAFGQGESGTDVSGGGSGLYGGYKGTSSKSGGAGSGYIGNSLVSNKKMVGYNVPTSSAEGTKTESVNDFSASAVSGKPKSGNGFARIKFLQEIDFFGFIEHMNVTDSSTRFEYIGANTGYIPLTVDLSDTHLASYNSWSDFSWLLKNKPYMVKADGTADYQLSETDYTKKADGVTASDVKNASYNGCGAFAWMPKIYTKQEIVGNDRYVYFSLTPKTGYDALGFKCLENGVEQELEGLWIPMFYGVTSNNKLMSICNDGKPSYGVPITSFKSQIENLSSRARFFGGAIINVIADLLMLLSRKGDIPTAFGNGVINASQSAWYPDTTIPTQSVVGTDRFWGYSDGNHLTKIFHSLLSSGILWQYDPYFKVQNSKFYHCPHYEWGEDVASDISAETTSGYYYATQFGLVDGFGRVPISPMSSTAIEPYYMYINSLISPSDSYSCRNGNYGTGRRGWYAKTFDSNFNYTAWDRNASPMILPPVGYKPD